MLSEPITLLEFYGGDLYDEAAVEAGLARLPAPRSPDVMLDKLRALGVNADDVVVDLGCGHGQYARQIASAMGCKVVALDLSRACVTETRGALDAAQATRVQVADAVAEALPLRAGSVGFIWCRDMLYHGDLSRALRECAAVLRPGGQMLVYQTFATDLLEPSEARRLYAATGPVLAENMDPTHFESCARDAGFTIAERDVIGSEWRETSEADAGSRVTAAKLLRAAQLLRGGEALRQQLGEKAYAIAVADQLWGIYQMIGKLCPTIYALRRR